MRQMNMKYVESIWALDDRHQSSIFGFGFVFFSLLLLYCCHFCKWETQWPRLNGAQEKRKEKRKILLCKYMCVIVCIKLENIVFSPPKIGWFIYSQCCSRNSRLMESIQFSIGIGGSGQILYHLVRSMNVIVVSIPVHTHYTYMKSNRSTPQEHRPHTTHYNIW